jgi:hypothetical protein
MKAPRASLTFVVAALVLFSAYSFKDTLTTANGGVIKFHSDFNAKKFDAIFANSSPEYRQAITAELNRRLFAGVYKKLGEAGEWSLAGWRVNVTPAGSLVNMQCKTKFALGEADESFVWRIRGKDASLVGYHINSLAFMPE